MLNGLIKEEFKICDGRDTDGLRIIQAVILLLITSAVSVAELKRIVGDMLSSTRIKSQISAISA